MGGAEAAAAETIQVSNSDELANAVNQANAAASATTIQLADDVSTDSTVDLGNENATITLDLNGHKLSMDNALVTTGTVAITDSASGGVIEFSGDAETGQLRIAGGTTSVDKVTLTTAVEKGILVNVASGEESATFSIGDDAVIDASGMTSGSAVTINSKGTVSMTGGEVNGKEYGLYVSGTLDVSGGAVSAAKAAVQATSGTVNVSGGTLTATGDKGTGLVAGKGTVSGGTFKSKSNDDGSSFMGMMNGCPILKIAGVQLAEGTVYSNLTGPDADDYYSVTAFEPASADAAKALDDAISSAKALDESDYTAASWEALQDAVTAADELTMYSYTDSEGATTQARDAKAVNSETKAIADAQANLVKVRFGSDKVQLEQGTWALPLTMQKAVSHSDASMAAECIKGAKVTVAADGTATVTVDLGAVNFAGQVGYGDNWQVYPGDAVSGTPVDATVLAANNDGHASTISFKVPDNGLDGVYVGMEVYIGSSEPQHQTAWFQLNWADAGAQEVSGKASFSKTYGDKSFSLGAKAQTALSYKSSNAKVAAVDKNGKVTVKGAGKAEITVSAAATDGYKAASKTVTVKVAKAANTMKVKTATKTVKLAKVKKAKQTVRAITVTKGKAKSAVTYAKKSGSAKLAVNAKTGKVTVKKGTKKGTYTAKVKVSAKATSNYKAASKTVTVKVKVK